MTAIVPAEPGSHADAPSSGWGLRIDESTADNSCIVHVSGELDVTTRNQLVSASSLGQYPNMMIDLGGVTFMDCSGYQALVAARRFIEGEGRRLAITGQIGQPARLLEMIAELEKCPLRPALNHRPPSPHRLGNGCRDNSAGVTVTIHNSIHKSIHNPIHN